MSNEDQNPLSPSAEAPRRSGMAVASLVCGLLYFVPPVPVVGLVLGIIALSRISASGGRQGGKGMAITGIVLGGVFTVLMCTAGPMAAMLLPAISRARDAARMTASKNNMKQIGLGVLMFENDNDGAMPASLQALYDAEYVKDPRIFTHPASGNTVDISAVDETSNYFLCPLAKPAAGNNYPPNAPIMWEKKIYHPFGAQLNVLFADGHVQLMPPEALTFSVEQYSELYTLKEPVIPQAPPGAR